MRYIFRADSSQAIGSGHVMRSSAIAEELIARGEETIFIGEFSDIPWLASRVHSLGFSQILDPDTMFISDPRTDTLILDSYFLSVADEFIQQDNWRRVVTISDALTPAYKADLIIYPALSENWKPTESVKFLTGPKYIPFRKSIKKRFYGPSINQTLQIIVVGGGTDPFNFVEGICKVLRNFQDDFHVQIFSTNEQLAQMDPRFTATQIGSQLDVCASTTDLVFTTASTTSLEFVAREIPLGIGCAVDNQEEYYESLASHGVAVPIGRFHLDRWEFNHSNIKELIRSKELRESLRQKSKGVVDLDGASRIADEIQNLI